MIESYSSKFIGKQPENKVTLEDALFAAQKGGWYVDPNDPDAPTLLRSYAKNPKRLREMTSPTEEHSEN